MRCGMSPLDMNISVPLVSVTKNSFSFTWHVCSVNTVHPENRQSQHNWPTVHVGEVCLVELAGAGPMRSACRRRNSSGCRIRIGSPSPIKVTQMVRWMILPAFYLKTNGFWG